MHTLSKRLFPKLSPAEALLRLQTEHLIKFGKNATQKHTQHEMLLTPKVMDVFVHYDTLLKSVYAFYATLDFPTYDNSNWKAVKNTNRSISMDEFTKFLLNFEVVPHCVSKRDALDIFRAVNEGDDADEFQDELNFPEFIECLARLSLLVAEKVHDKLTETAATISEMAACKKYIARCSEQVKLHYKEAYDKRFSGSRSPAIDYEARAERQEQQKEEMEKEMEKHHQYYLQMERQRALHRLHNQHTATAAQLQRSGQHRNLLKSQHLMERRMLQSAPAALSVRMRDLSHYIQSDLQVKFLMDSSYKPVVPEREIVGPELEMFEKRMKEEDPYCFLGKRPSAPRPESI
ncbi:hypothetical protein CYMTET_12542 [Cymbomonas tetramitiformis]|uniref:Uncharacterized protein n=1 Tax=Cymbomonas tetramitiformis TaxID=36881 RepID=A0AAE0GJX2_9CHLO|nr:hypothetical protein CYMTET_12542 [Cymbomonas tetramitiformis]